MRRTVAILLFSVLLIPDALGQETRSDLTLEEIRTLNTNLDPSITMASVLFPGTSHFYTGKPIEGSLTFLLGMAGEITCGLGTYFIINSSTQNGASGNNIPYANTTINITTTHEYNYIAVGAIAVGAVIWAAAVMFDVVDAHSQLIDKKSKILLEHQELIQEKR